MGCESSKQAFCSLGKQTVKDHSSITFDYSNGLFNKDPNSLSANEIAQMQGTTITTKEINLIIDALTKIKDFGAAGTRNPTQAQMNELAKALQYQGINADTYDKIIKILDSNTTIQHQYTPIKGSYLYQIREKINNYKLNTDRCDTCNTSCNAGCQVASQAPPCDSCQPGCNTSCESYVCGQGNCGESRGCRNCQSDQSCRSGNSSGGCRSHECSSSMCRYGG